MSLDLGTLVGYLDIDDTKFSQGLDTAGEDLKGFGGKGAKIAAAAGVAIAGALVASIAVGMNIEAANDKLAAQLGLSAAESERIGGVAGDLYAGAYGESLDQVNEAVGAVMSSMDGMRKASSADLESMTAKVLDLAAGFDLDVARSAQVAGQMIKSGLAKDGVEAMDLLTASMQRVPAAIREDILDAVDEYGPFMEQLGLKGEAAMGLLVAASEKGMFGIDKTGDAIKEFSIRSTDMSAASKVGYDAMGMSQEKMTNKLLAGGPSAQKAFGQMVEGLRSIKDPAAQSQAALALFGTPLEDLSVQEIPKFLAALDKGSAAMDDTAGAADRFGTTLNDNAKTSLTSLKRQAEQTFGKLGNWALPIVNDMTKALAEDFGPALGDVADFITDTVIPAIKDFGKWVEENKTPIKIVAGIITALLLPALIQMAVQAAISGAETVAVWAMIQASAIRSTVVSVAQFAIQGAKWVLLGVVAMANAAVIAAAWLISMGPIGLVIAAIAAVVVGLVAAWKHSETFRDIVKGALHAVGAAATWLWEKAIAPAIAFIINGYALVFDAIAAVLDALGNIRGFGWAKTAADKMANAADKARAMANGINDIPDNKTVTVRYQVITDALLGNTAPSFGPLPKRAHGGPVEAFTSYLVNEQGPEILTMGSTSGYITPNGATPPGSTAGGSSPELLAEVQGLRADIRAAAVSGSSDGAGQPRGQLFGNVILAAPVDVDTLMSRAGFALSTGVLGG